jgi:hypothetical protein
MTKKMKPNDDEQNEEDSAKVNAELDESAAGEGEAVKSGPESQPVDEVSVDDLLDDVRRSLIEETRPHEKKPGWLSRIKKGFQKEHVDAPLDAPPAEASAVMPEAQKKNEDYLEQIDELIEMLESDETQPNVAAILAAEAMPPAEPVTQSEPAPIDLNDLKKRVFNPGEAGGMEENLIEVRAVALEGGEEVFVEVEARKVDQTEERMKAFENAMRPYRRYIYFLVSFLGVLLAVVAVFMMIGACRQNEACISRFVSIPAPTPTVGNLPYPQSMVLPGGLSFALGRGAITDGEWNPTKPEWLAGTEICRWVAIPWSRQLEAVVRTLTLEDSIDLLMSNGDTLTYHVHSIRELSLAEMQDLDQNSPCLLLVLAEQEAEKRWVVTAKP